MTTDNRYQELKNIACLRGLSPKEKEELEQLKENRFYRISIAAAIYANIYTACISEGMSPSLAAAKAGEIVYYWEKATGGE